jgi:RNA polymerase sigma-70 factor (ECF subfamily)
MPEVAATGEAEDLRLARQAAAGDARAFERLYRMHVDRIYGLCCRLCHGDTARADQSVQDAFVRAWERLGSFRGESRFGTWLHRLTVNVVLGEHRLLRRWVTFEDNGGEGEAAVELLEPQQDNTGLGMDLERAMARLPKGARTVLVLHDIEGYQHDEIAELTGIAVGTSKAQLHRARKLMKEWLQ